MAVDTVNPIPVITCDQPHILCL